MVSRDITSENVNEIRGGLAKNKKEKSVKVIALYNLGTPGPEIAAKLKMPELDVQQILLNYKRTQ